MNKIKKTNPEVWNILTKLKIDYFTNFSASTSSFYGLPKICKSALISEATAKQNEEYVEVLEPTGINKLRPIVAGPTCPTQLLSDLSDKIIKPFILHVIYSNIDFLERFSKVNDKNTILATFDVISLYTNIPHAYGLEAVLLDDKHPGSRGERFSKYFVLESARLIPENNNCKFNDEFYVQINRTAMGTIFALHMQRFKYELF